MFSSFFSSSSGDHRDLHSFPTRRSSDLSSPNVFEMAATETITSIILIKLIRVSLGTVRHPRRLIKMMLVMRSEERFSRNAETDLVCRLLLEKKKKKKKENNNKIR